MIFSFHIIMELVVLTSFWCIAVHMNGQKKEDFFYFLNVWSYSTLLKKPLYHCVNCMASIHSAIIICIYFFISGVWQQFAIKWENVGKLFLLWLIVAVISSGVNGFLKLIYLFLEWFIAKLQYESKDDENE